MALSLLQGYSSNSEDSNSDSEEDDIVITIDRRVVSGAAPPTKKPCIRKEPQPNKFKDVKKSKPEPSSGHVTSTLDLPHYDMSKDTRKDALPIPREINDMFIVDEEHDRDDPALHEGRLRSFAHSANSWASYVYIDLSEMDLADARDLIAEQLHMEPIVKPHLSLSRVVSLRHHWLDPLARSLTQSLGQERPFHLGLDKLQVYVNDEGTRTFVGLTASVGWSQLSRLSRRVDACLAEYSLPTFYRSKILPQLQNLSLKLVDCLDEDVLRINSVHCKAGNKLFKFSLV